MDDPSGPSQAEPAPDRSQAAQSPEGRTQEADDRDQRADDRDLGADDRDRASEARDERARARDEQAAIDREEASRDRLGGASDRKHAADDRDAATAERGTSAKELKESFTDELTGARRREAGYLELEREIAKAIRTKRPFTLAFIDVDGLKAINDSRGHAAGDQLLRQVVDAMRTTLRSYDLIVRYGGDEFLCSLPDLNVELAAKRFEAVKATLAAANASITVGFAELEGVDDSLEAVIARADAELYRARERNNSAR